MATGLRASEFSALKIEDIDWEHSIVIVTRGKGGKRRRVGLKPELLERLKAHLIKRPQLSETAFIWLDTKEKSMQRDGLRA